MSTESPTLEPLTPIIFQGEAPDRAVHDAVVSLHELDRRGDVFVDPFCTGTLITPTVVLTAAHCLDVAPARARDFEEADAARLGIFVGDRPRRELPAGLYDVVEVQIHAGYDRHALKHDIGLMRLDRPVRGVTPVPPLPSSMGFGPQDRGVLVDFVGFGDQENGGYGTKRHVEIPLAGPGCALRSCDDAGYPMTQVSYAQGDGGPCSGDSGGPLFLDRGPLTFVAGVTSYGDARCTRYGVSTRVDAYERFISDFVSR